MPDFLDSLLLDHAMVICCGSGGVGKTTTSAVLGLRAAQLGKKALVLTIDPAKRLANSLGLETLGNTIARVEDTHFLQAGLDIPGELHAMMLDSKRTFDGLVEDFSPTAAAAESIFKNKYYQHVSKALNGSHEYMAMEKLYELHQKNEFDIIILDTPPTHNALDFLDAPSKMTDFLDESILKWFIKPYFIAGKLGFETAKIGSKFFMGILEKVTGLQVLHDLSDFFISFKGMYAGFKDRAALVRETLKSSKSVFLLVTSPNPLTVKECIFFHQKLGEYELKVGGILVNKMHRDFGLGFDQDPEKLVQEVEAILGPDQKDLCQRLVKNALNFQALYQLDQESLKTLGKDLDFPRDKIKTAPYFEDDIFDVSALKLLLESLFDEARSPAASAKPRLTQQGSMS